MNPMKQTLLTQMTEFVVTPYTRTRARLMGSFDRQSHLRQSESDRGTTP